MHIEIAWIFSLYWHCHITRTLGHSRQTEDALCRVDNGVLLATHPMGLGVRLITPAYNRAEAQRIVLSAALKLVETKEVPEVKTALLANVTSNETSEGEKAHDCYILYVLQCTTVQ